MISLQSAGVREPYDCEGFEAYLGEDQPLCLWSTGKDHLCIHSDYLLRYLEFLYQRGKPVRRNRNELHEVLVSVLKVDVLCTLVRSYLGFVGKWEIVTVLDLMYADRLRLAAVDEKREEVWLWENWTELFVKSWSEAYFCRGMYKEQKIIRGRLITEDGAVIRISKKSMFVRGRLVVKLNLPYHVQNAVQGEDGTVYVLLETGGLIIKIY